MAKYKKTNDVTGAGRKVSNYDKNHSSGTGPKRGENAPKKENKAAGSKNNPKSPESPKGDSKPSGRKDQSFVGTSGYVNPSFNGSRPHVSRTPTSMSEDTLRQALGSMNNEVNRKTGTGHVQTASQAEIQAIMRTVASTNKYNSNNFISSDQAKSSLRVIGNDISGITGGMKNGTVSVLSQVSRLSASDDSGTAAIGTIAAAGIVGIKGFEAAQRISDTGIAVGSASVKGAVALGDFTVKSYKTLDRFSSVARVTPLSGNAFNILKSQALGTGLDQTRIAKSLLMASDKAMTAVNHGVNGIQTIIDTAIKTGQQGMMIGRITRNVFSGAYSGKEIIQGTAYGIKKGAAALGYGAQKLGVNGVKMAASGMRWTFINAFPKTMKILSKGSAGTWSFAGKALMGSDDLGLQSVGTAMETTYQAARISVKTGKAAVKTTKATVQTMQTGGKTIVYAGKGAYRAGKGAVKGAKFIKNKGLKAAWKKGRQKAVKAAAKGIKKTASVLMEIMKRLGAKLIIPICVILVIAIGFNLVTAPVMAVAGVFSGVFNDEDTGAEVNIDQYLNDTAKGIPAKTEALKNDLVSQLSAAASTYNIARFRANTSAGEGGLITDHTYSAVSAVFPSDTEIIEMVKPLFQAVILMNYENSPTDAECQQLIDHIMDTMFVITQVDTTEYCGQDLVTGEGDVDNCSSCGDVHAHSDCPNPLPLAKHSSYTCDNCCYYYCPGHDHTDSSGNSYTTYCSGCVHDCNGHTDCGGHSVTTFTLNCDGIYSLVQEYFLDPIDALESTSRTDDQEQQLSMLKSFYEIFEEMANLVSIGGYSGSIALEDLSGVQWVDGTRTGCNEIIEYAKQFLGNKGGRPFWSYLGFGGRVAWCACFVYYIMKNSGYGDSYPSSVNYAYCPDMTTAFSNVGRFAGREFRDIVPGDVIYFDYKGQGESHHTGIVIGRDETTVYTIEGNSGDQVKIKSYDLNSGVIFGYGLMNY